jgi:hypothetical protein
LSFNGNWRKSCGFNLRAGRLVSTQFFIFIVYLNISQ